MEADKFTTGLKDILKQFSSDNDDQALRGRGRNHTKLEKTTRDKKRKTANRDLRRFARTT